MEKHLKLVVEQFNWTIFIHNRKDDSRELTKADVKFIDALVSEHVKAGTMSKGYYDLYLKDGMQTLDHQIEVA